MKTAALVVVSIVVVLVLWHGWQSVVAWTLGSLIEMVTKPGWGN